MRDEGCPLRGFHCISNVGSGVYKGKERSTAVFAIVIRKSKVCRHALLLLGPFFVRCGSQFSTNPCFVLPIPS